ncbi:extradiol dioxygenase [Duganella rhizosphaerae]|uniref:VOC family protein n=1 Tax=Duganella rhizosphaerae TaxID=2885763 RepID=UPI0030E88B51
MATNIFVNLPVRDLAASVKFFSHLGYSFNQQYTDDSATCMIVAENIFVMLLVEERFKGFTPKPICDARTSTEVLLCLQVESREQVTSMVNKAIEAGGSAYKEPQDHGFMYGHGYQDLDGHLWEIIYMDTAPPAKS